eukprot:GHRQ01023886.1.p1 GENE.GHRQ01023886.1~~GHRQ01023886.1.p1  ORF type:complete len:148 (-),score=44.51 GHRQ01023886.1:50-493(-)
MGWRYGPIAKTIVFLIAMFNMCIALLAEYTTIGSIFSDFVGSVSYGIIIVVGVLTLAYTAYGGLAVSIATDMVQGVASVILAVVLTIFVAVTYRWVRKGFRPYTSPSIAWYGHPKTQALPSVNEVTACFAGSPQTQGQSTVVAAGVS